MRISPDRSRPDAPEHPGQPAGDWLLRQHQLFIARYARQLGRGAAEDLASEAIVRSLRHPAPDGRHGPWLERVFRNLMVDHLRRRARGRRVGGMADDSAARGDSPEQRAAEAQLRRRLAVLWPQLRPEWRQALASSFGEDHPETRAAAATGVSPTTVRTRTYRALGVLRRALGVMRGWVPLPTSTTWSAAASAQLQPLAGALLPGAVAMTVLVAPAAPEQPGVTAPAVLAQVVQRRPSSPTPAPPAPATIAPGAPAPDLVFRPRPPRAPSPPGADPAKAVQHFQFDDDDITGNLQRPDGDDITGAPARPRHASLIEIPHTFTAALVRTLEDL